MSYSKPIFKSERELDVNGEPLSANANGNEGGGRRDSLDYSFGVKRQREASPDDYRNTRARGYENRDSYSSSYNQGSSGGGGYGSGGYNNNSRYGGGGGYNNNYNNSNNYYGGGGYGSRKVEDPYTLDYLVPLRQFSDYVRQKHKSSGSRQNPVLDLTEDQVRDKFRVYREEFQSRSLWKFFTERRRDEWFIEKYHPTDSKPLRDQISNRKSTESLPIWSRELQQGKFDGISFDAAAGQQGDDSNDGFGGVDLKVPKAWELNALFLKTVPMGVTRREIVEVCQDTTGFKHLVLSDPRSDKGFVRLGWIVFEEGTNLEAALQTLNGKRVNETFALSLAPQVSQPYRSRVIPVDFNTLERITSDLERVERVAKALDLEANIAPEQGLLEVQKHCDEVIQTFPTVPEPTAAMDTDPEIDGDSKEKELDAARGVMDTTDDASVAVNPLALPEKPTPPTAPAESPYTIATKKILKLRLDVTIEYLRRVHYYDFYSGMEADGPEDFQRRSWVILRSTTGIPAPRTSPSRPSTSSTETPYVKQTEFQRLAERLESRVHIRALNILSATAETSSVIASESWGGDPLLKIGGKNPTEYVDVQIGTHIQEVDEEKFRCGQCSKLFRGKEFVAKHLKSKHPELVEAADLEARFFNNYVKDPNRVHNQGQGQGMGGVPMQQGGSAFGSGDRGGYGGGDRGGYNDRRGGGGFGGGQRRPPPMSRDGRPMPVDPRARKTYEDLDGAPVGDVNELNYD
ncbi:UNVERIFIED_CONTAM: hypothetical protein HDU68_012598 [Siphonaria sp. JEL0065]|nr:hypothetical protein HDU68_012598 [Siphonaria sp. JEL0065]